MLPIRLTHSTSIIVIVLTLLHMRCRTTISAHAHCPDDVVSTDTQVRRHPHQPSLMSTSGSMPQSQPASVPALQPEPQAPRCDLSNIQLNARCSRQELTCLSAAIMIIVICHTCRLSYEAKDLLMDRWHPLHLALTNVTL